MCRFIGACVKDPKNLVIVSEYCPKGSLNDVLQNQDIPLNWGFRFSFATDIARAMTYLHGKRIYHGRLKSSNCVIDDRWVVKISGNPPPPPPPPKLGKIVCINNHYLNRLWPFIISPV